MTTTSTTPSSDPKTGKSAVILQIRLSGALPRSGALASFTTEPGKLTRAEIGRVRDQLAEMLGFALTVRLNDAVIELLSEDGRVLRSSRLLEAPARDRYLAAEVAPGEGAGPLEAWLVKAALSFGRKRSV
ncbi:hypothetical protein [Miltoncostaea oceani]|uniref:hypothetical protein n=1 Tax=Miltoncostaea oceani TaxID=2843216 RepID=UPI001C3E32AB|nr:hypothetical protein [Miltoncostaea oceani]